MSKDIRISDDPLPSSECVPYIQRLAVPMFCLSLFYLVLLGGLTVVWVDMAEPVELTVDGDVVSSTAVVDSDPVSLPIEAEVKADVANVEADVEADVKADVEADVAGVEAAAALVEGVPDTLVGLRKSAIWTGYILFGMLVAIWPLFWLESIFRFFYGRRNDAPKKAGWPNDLSVAVCPPLRLAKPIAEMNGEIWLPRIGWNPPGKPLSKLLEKIMSKPMLGIALLILPILLIEFGLSKHVQSKPWLRLTLSISTGLIWCAFAIEFIIMVSATDKKFAYVKKNWIDLAIILLPLISFLRSLRVVRAANIAKYAKVQQLTKMSRIYRMRGLVAKSIRALMVLGVVHRVLNVSPEKRIEKLSLQLEELEEEADEIRSQIKLLQSQIAVKDEEDVPEQRVAQNESEEYRAATG